MLVVLTVLFVIIITVTILLIKFYQPCRDYFNFNKNDESTCKYVSSRGILKSCDIHSTKPMSSVNTLIGYENIDFSEIKSGSSVYVCSIALHNFLNVFKTLKYPIVLVTGDCDETVPDLVLDKNDYEYLINSDKLIHWFSQNTYSNLHPKLTQIPIGLDYHTPNNTLESSDPKSEESLLQAQISINKPYYERENKAYSNCHLYNITLPMRYRYDRTDALKDIPTDLVYLEPGRIKRVETWEHQSNYAFVVSPHGNGLDCHRTWEALLLGCIPIVKTSILDDLFSELPVLIVQNWSDVSKELLDNTVSKYKNKTFNYDKLTLEYWISQIRIYKQN